MHCPIWICILSLNQPQIWLGIMASFPLKHVSFPMGAPFTPSCCAVIRAVYKWLILALSLWASGNIAPSYWVEFVLDHVSGIGKENIHRGCLESPREKSFKESVRPLLSAEDSFFPLQGQNGLSHVCLAEWKRTCN